MLPVFTTERLVLRPRRLTDIDACLAMDRAPGVTRFVNGPWQDAAAHRAFIEARTLGPYPEGMGYWSLVPRETLQRFIGWVLLIPVDAVGPAIEIGWRLVPEHWGRGFATEAARPLLAHAFRTLRLDEIEADIDRDNAGSCRVAEKLGFRALGEIEHGGRTALHYALRREEFEASEAAAPADDAGDSR